MRKTAFISAALFTISLAVGPVCAALENYWPEEKIVVYGEYPAAEEVGSGVWNGAFEGQGLGSSGNGADDEKSLIDYGRGIGYKEKALIEALHIMNANIYGYTFLYRPGSKLMKTEEVFTIELRGELGKESVNQIAEGVNNTVYRVKLEFNLTPSSRKWMKAFRSNTLRLEEAEGTSDFYSGWEGRSAAFREALRNLVLITAKKRLSSKPLVMEGDILLSGNPEFSVGAGRHYCKIQGFVNIVEVVTYD